MVPHQHVAGPINECVHCLERTEAVNSALFGRPRSEAANRCAPIGPRVRSRAAPIFLHTEICRKRACQGAIYPMLFRALPSPQAVDDGAQHSLADPNA
jgi:hypothetical protein